MHKKICLLITFVMLFSISLTACGKKDNKGKESDSSSINSVNSNVEVGSDYETSSLPSSSKDNNKLTSSNNSTVNNGDTESNVTSNNSGDSQTVITSKNNLTASNSNLSSKNDNTAGNVSVPNNNTSGSSKPTSSGNSGSQGTASSSPSGSTSSKPDNSKEEFKTLTYEEYIKLEPSEQQKYFETFESPIDFGKWHEEAKKEYEENKDAIDVSGNGTFDLEMFLD